MLTDEPTKLWEPWVPTVGQRVRIRLSGECRVIYTNVVTGEDTPHIMAFDGVLGRVIGFRTDSGAMIDGHRFRVMFDKPVSYEGVSYRGADFAAAELEPLEEPCS